MKRRRGSDSCGKRGRERRVREGGREEECGVWGGVFARARRPRDEEMLAGLT